MATVYVGQYADAGSRNTFYRLNNSKYGFKSFEEKRLAEFSYRVQKHLASIDLAPRVYGEVGRIRVPDVYDDGTELSEWGYITEIAKLLPYCYSRKCDGDCYDSDCKNGYIIREVIDALEANGLSYIDGHRGNVGYVRRNRKWVPVVIDVGYESFDDFDPDIYGHSPYDDESDEDSDGVCQCDACKAWRKN